MLYSFGKNLLMFIYFSRIFDSPRPEGDIVQSCVDRMRLTLLEALKHKGPEQKLFRVSTLCFQVFVLWKRKSGSRETLDSLRRD